MHRFKSVNENIVKTFDTILRKIARYRLIIESFLSIYKRFPKCYISIYRYENIRINFVLPSFRLELVDLRSKHKTRSICIARSVFAVLP